MQSRAYTVFSNRTRKKSLSREKSKHTLLRANNFNGTLKDIRCEDCGKILFQSYAGVYMIVKGHPDIETDPGLLGADTIILQCHGMLIIEKNGEHINTRCSARYFIT